MNISVDIEPVPDIESMSGTVRDNLLLVIHNHIDRVRDHARLYHRYTRRTGNLESATKSSKTSTGGTVYIDDGQAIYGKYIHEGFKSWAADPFLYDAESDLDGELNQAIDNALNQSGFHA